MFHRQKTDQQPSSDVQTTSQDLSGQGTQAQQDVSGPELTTNPSGTVSSNAPETMPEIAGETPDVSIPPTTGVTGQRRIGVRIAGGNNDTPSQQQTRAFNGFNRLQTSTKSADANIDNTQGQNADEAQTTNHNDQLEYMQEEDIAVNTPQNNPNETPINQGVSEQDAQTPESSISEGRQLIVGKGISLTGEIQECNHLVVEGRVEAALKGSKVLEIKQEGTFIGSVEIEQATIAGIFEGEITVNGRLTILDTGNITGTISYKELEIQAGAKLDGKVSPITAPNFKSSASKQAAASKSGDEKSKSSKAGASTKAETAKSKDAELPLGQDA